VITREVVLSVNFVLGARVGIGLDTAGTVAAHPNAARQCRRWLRTHMPSATVVEVLSNAAAAEAAATGQYDAAGVRADRCRGGPSCPCSPPRSPITRTR